VIPEVRIRRATEADLPRLVELLQQLSLSDNRESPTTPLPESYRAALRQIEADPRQQMLVAERQGRIAATLVLGIVANLSHRGRPWAFIENVVVDSAERGKGYGEALMRYAIDQARTAGCYKLVLTSNKQRLDAHRFYQRLGFEASHEGFRMLF
jgi:GNAT superfamily N-acetyltransferase